MDLAALIASALSSNLYLNGLAELDYLNLPANMKPYDGNFIDSARESAVYDNEIARAATENFDKFDGESEKMQMV